MPMNVEKVHRYVQSHHTLTNNIDKWIDRAVEGDGTTFPLFSVPNLCEGKYSCSDCCCGSDPFGGYCRCELNMFYNRMVGTHRAKQNMFASLLILNALKDFVNGRFCEKKCSDSKDLS